MEMQTDHVASWMPIGKKEKKRKKEIELCLWKHPIKNNLTIFKTTQS